MNALLWSTAGLFLNCLFDYVTSHSIGIDWNLVAEHGIYLAFCLVSILILHLPEKANFKSVVKF